ncbi:hypothetical protein JCM6882_001796 [Rhodosporidiobolus microsporus]
MDHAPGPSSHLTYSALPPSEGTAGQSPATFPPSHASSWPAAAAGPSALAGPSSLLQPHQLGSAWGGGGEGEAEVGDGGEGGSPGASAAGKGGKGKKGAGAGGGKGKKRASLDAGGTAPAVGEKLDKDGHPKKKRKQLVACDSCRLRRVKCDKAEKLGGACSECEKKSITCTDSYVKNRPKVVRSGKLIAQAKLLYGDPGSSASPTGHNGAPISPDSAVGGDAPSPIEDVRRASSASAGHVVAVKPAEGRLMGSQMNHDVAEKLTHTFLTHLHPQCPLFDQDAFMQAFEAAGRVAENMTPANECLALVMQAWAARFSDFHLILGAGAPTHSEIRQSGASGRDFTILGNRRDVFAKAMAERAIQAVDRRGVLRNSSAVGSAALTLLEFLVCFDDPHRTSTRGRYFLSNAVEHLRNLQLGQCDEPGEECMPPERAANGTMLWVVYTRDAVASLFGGRNCSLTDDDLALLCDLFVAPFAADPQPFVSSTDARTLSGIAVAAIFRFCVSSIRNTISRLTGPLPRRQRLEEPVLHELWAELDESARLAGVFRQSVQSAMLGPEYKSDIWFRDLIVLRAQHTLGIHLSIVARIREEEAAAQEPQTEDNGPYLDLLRRVKRQSDGRLLAVSRDYAGLVHGYGSDLLHSAAFSIEYSASFLHCMVESLAWEQGGGNESWGWGNKVEEVTNLIEALKLIGWCWAGYDRLIECARTSLAEQAAFLQQAQQQQQQEQHDRRASDTYSVHSGYEQQIQPAYPPPAPSTAYHPQPAYPSAAPNGTVDLYAAPPSAHYAHAAPQPTDYAFSSLSAPSFPGAAPTPPPPPPPPPAAAAYSSASYAQPIHAPALPPTPTPSPGHAHAPQQPHHLQQQQQQHLHPPQAHHQYPSHAASSGVVGYAADPLYNGRWI